MIFHAVSIIPIAQGEGFDWGALLPIVIILFYALSQFLGSSKKEEKKKPEQDSTARRPAAQSQAEAEEEARARQIREEIQRRIAERQQGESGQRERPAEAERRPAYDPRLPDSQQRRAATPPPIQERPAERRVPQQRAQAAQAARAAAKVERADSVQARLAEQRKRLEQSRQERDSAMRKAREITSQAARFQEREDRFSWNIADTSPARLREDVLEALADPAGAQKAVLFREILGPPLAYRDPTASTERIP